jgi:hypothetical protein
MPTVNSSGTQTAVITTEHALADLTSNKYFSADINLTLMVAGDITEVRMYKKVLPGGALVLYWMDTFTDVQDNKLLHIPNQPSAYEWKLTLKQTAGTGRDYEWVIYEA